MEEGQSGGSGWAIWVLIPVAVVLTVLATKWILKPRSSVPVGVTEQYTGGNADEVLTAKNRQAEAEELRPAESNVQYKPVMPVAADPEPERQTAPAVSAAQPPGSASEAAAAAAAGRTVKEQRNSGLTYGFLTKAVGSL